MPCFTSTSKLQTGDRPDRPAVKANASGEMSVQVQAVSGEMTVPVLALPISREALS